MTEHQSKDDLIQDALALQASYPAELKIRLGQVIYNNFLSDEERNLVVGTALDCFQSDEIPHETLDWLMEQRANDRWVRQLVDNNDCQHPLTDKIMVELQGAQVDSLECYMRAAADWQFEQVIDFILKEDTVYYDDPALLADYIREAMRPTTQEDLEDVQLALERMNSVPKPITLEELMTLDDTTPEDN